METRDMDKRSRDLIVSGIDRNLFVEAGAGSGKTTSLVSRMVAMVEAGIDVSRICAITFTRAAAAEFYKRFQAELIKRKDSPLCQAALENIDLCFMGTIDAFCCQIINEHPAEAGVPAEAQVQEDVEMKAAYQKEFARILAGLYGEDLSRRAEAFSGWSSRPSEQFAAFMDEIMSLRNAEFICPELDEGAKKTIAEAEEAIRYLVPVLLDHPELLYTNNKDSVGAWELLVERGRALTRPWEGRYDDILYLLKKTGKIRLLKSTDLSQLGKYGPKTFCLGGQRQGWYETSETGPFGVVNLLEEMKYSQTMDLLVSAADPMAKVLQREGTLGYFDYLLYLRDLLRKDAAGSGSLIRHISRRHSYFLIDEFQDTNPLQAEIFFYLAAEEPVEDWKQCIPRPGSLFIVGDPKQSIYRFRSADVKAFHQVRQLFESDWGNVVPLARNFRSADELKVWFNQVFAQMMPEDTEDQSKFLEIPLDDKETKDLAGVYTYAPGDSDADTICRIVRALVEDGDATIDGEPVRYGDFMVITSNKNPIGDLIRSFNEARIPYKVEGKLLFSECPALVGLVSAFRAAAVPDSREYAYEARRRGFQPETLKGCAKGKTPLVLFEELLDQERILEEFGTENLEYLYFAEELLRRQQTGSMRDAAEFLSQLLLGDTDEERCMGLVENADLVHIANLHKVKGLEAKIVILAESTPGRNTVSRRVSDGECRIFSLGKWNTGQIRTKCFEEEKELEKISNQAEKIRLLYVAATRAERVLLMAAGKRSYWQPLIEQTSETWQIPAPAAHTNVPDPAGAGAPAQTLDGWDACKTATRSIALPSKVKEKTVAEDPSYVPEKSLYEEEESTAALAGTMIHRLMEMVVSSGGWPGSDAQLIQSITEEYGLDLSAKLASVLHVMRQGGYPQTNHVPQDLLQVLEGAEQVFCELPFCCQDDEGTLWNGVMDLVYQEGGRWHIVDYKTNADGTNLDERYAAQLEAYTRAFQQLTGEKADAGTYHIG